MKVFTNSLGYKSLVSPGKTENINSLFNETVQRENNTSTVVCNHRYNNIHGMVGDETHCKSSLANVEGRGSSGRFMDRFGVMLIGEQ